MGIHALIAPINEVVVSCVDTSCRSIGMTGKRKRDNSKKREKKNEQPFIANMTVNKYEKTP